MLLPLGSTIWLLNMLALAPLFRSLLKQPTSLVSWLLILSQMKSCTTLRGLRLLYVWVVMSFNFDFFLWELQIHLFPETHSAYTHAHASLGGSLTGSWIIPILLFIAVSLQVNDLINCGVYVFTPQIFTIIQEVVLQGNNTGATPLCIFSINTVA